MKTNESMRTSYKFSPSWRPVSEVDFHSRNFVNKVDVFSAFYYLCGTYQIKPASLEYMFTESVKLGLHPVLVSTFFKFYFNLQVGDFTYRGSLHEFPQFATTRKYEDFKSNFIAVMSSSRGFKAIFSKVIKDNSIVLESAVNEELIANESEARFDYKLASDEAQRISSKLNKDWSNLRQLWAQYFNVPVDEFDGIDGVYIRKIYDKKIIKYLDMTKDIVRRMINSYPRNVFNDEEDFYSAATEELVRLTRNFYLSPSTWKMAYDKANKNLLTGPAILRGMREAPLEMNPSKLGGMLLRIKSAVYDVMRQRDNLTPYFRDKVNQVKELVNNYIKETGFKPQVDYIASTLKMKPDDVKEYLKLMELKDVNFDSNIATDSRAMNAVQIGAPKVDWENPLIIVELIDELNKGWAIITRITNDQEKLVASLFIMEELSMKEVAQTLNESVNDVTEVYEGAMEKCRPHFRSQLLKGY